MMIQDVIGDIDQVINYVEGVSDGINKPTNLAETQDFSPDFTMDVDGAFIPPPGVDPDIFIDEILKEMQYKKNTQTVEWLGAVSANRGIEKGVDDATPIKLLEGSICKRKDGRWMGQYYDNGSKKTVYSRSKLDLVVKVNDCIRIRDQNAEADRRGMAKKITLSDFIDAWYSDWVDSKSRSKPLSSASLLNVKSSLFKYVKENKLAKKPINRINVDDLDKILDSIPTKSMQARTYAYLNQVFDRALKRKLIKDNPMDVIDRRAKPQPDKVKLPSIELWNEFLEFTKQSPDVYYIATFATWTGMRLGEILALTWSDVNLEKGYITVNKSFDTHTQKVSNHPKTDAGFRNVPIFAPTRLLLSEIIKKNNAPVFWMCSTWTINKKVVNWMRRFGKLGNMTFHKIRHLFASICLSAGVDKKTYSKWMGHTEVALTQSIYTHVLSDFELEQVKLMAKFSNKND